MVTHKNVIIHTEKARGEMTAVLYFSCCVLDYMLHKRKKTLFFKTADDNDKACKFFSWIIVVVAL